MKLTQARLKKVLRYNRKTGVFTWRVRKSCCIFPGDVAGRVQSTGYREVTIDGVGYRAHRLAWLYVKGCWPKKMLDHRDGVRDNNAWLNLREADSYQNQHNLRQHHRDNGTRALGVTFNKLKRKWAARIRAYGVRKFLGYFGQVEDAKAAYAKAKTVLHPFAS